jgi:hypothetical protein
MEVLGSWKSGGSSGLIRMPSIPTESGRSASALCTLRDDPSNCDDCNYQPILSWKTSKFRNLNVNASLIIKVHVRHN